MATNLELIKEIEEIRSNNNKNWMDILRIAFDKAPVKSKKIMKRITENDKQISNLTSKLGGE